MKLNDTLERKEDVFLSKTEISPQYLKINKTGKGNSIMEKDSSRALESSFRCGFYFSIFSATDIAMTKLNDRHGLYTF